MKRSSVDVSEARAIEINSPEGLRAKRLALQYSALIAVVGLAPVPLLDLLLIGLLQGQMFREIGERFDKYLHGMQIFYSIMASAFRRAIIPWLIWPLLFGLVKFIPGIGSVVGALGLPIIVGGVSYALGRTYVQQLEAERYGGILDIEKLSA